jgi:hypothetical protein
MGVYSHIGWPESQRVKASEVGWAKSLQCMQQMLVARVGPVGCAGQLQAPSKQRVSFVLLKGFACYG